MANVSHLEILNSGVVTWNHWRELNPEIMPDLSKAMLTGMVLSGANLSNTDFSESHAGRVDFSKTNLLGADFSKSYYVQTTFSGADLRGANFSHATFWDGVNFEGADLREANFDRSSFVTARFISCDLRRAQLTRAEFSGADFRNADLGQANLLGAQFIETNFENAILSNCNVYGTSAWDLNLTGAEQRDLVITYPGSQELFADNLEVAQFIYMLSNNNRVRGFIDTITTKMVLILGRFTNERKLVLDAIKQELRSMGFVPVLFDFDRPSNRDLTETISLLARMSRFVIADLTDAKSLPQELSVIIPDLPSVPVQPLLQSNSREYSMFEHFRRYPWVLPVYLYENLDILIQLLRTKVIEPSERKREEFFPGGKN